MVKRIIFGLLLAACLFLTSCTSGIPISTEGKDVSLPDGTLPAKVTIGDTDLDSVRTVQMYFPAFDNRSICTTRETVEFGSSKSDAECIVRAMLSFEENEQCDSLGGKVELALQNIGSVECSRNTVTVNLSASAGRLSRNRLFMVGQCLANTLCQLEEIDYVNLLIAGKAVGLDVGNSLPTGAFEETEETDINALYKRKTNRKSEDNTVQYFTSNVTMYYPLAEMDVLVCSTQSLSFPDQNIGNMVQTILSRLSLGLGDMGSLAPQLPLLNDFLTFRPALLASEEAGGNIIQLDFAQNLEDMLAAYHVSKEASMASLCKTICGYFPNLEGIRVSIDGSPVESGQLKENTTQKEHGDLYLTENLTVPIYDYAKLYFKNKDNELTETTRPLPDNQCHNPRRLLLELAKGPQSCDSLKDLQPLMPEGMLTEGIIIGITREDYCLQVNLSPAFAAAGEGMSAKDEQCLVYSMVDTLSADPAVHTVAFYINGEQFEGFGNDVVWKGVFYPSLLQQEKG